MSQDGGYLLKEMIMIIMSGINLDLLFCVKKLLFTLQLNSVARYKKTKTQNLFLNSRQEICKVGISNWYNENLSTGSGSLCVK